MPTSLGVRRRTPSTPQPPPPSARDARSWDLAVIAVGMTAATVVGAQAWSRGIGMLWPSEDPVVVGLQFGSFLLVVGGAGAVLWPWAVGLRLGATLLEWRMVLMAAAGLGTVTWLLVLATGPNTYSDADVLFEVVLVPVGEELVFRGLVLGWLLQQFRARLPDPSASRRAVVVGAVAFGLGHASNALFGAGTFALVQVVAATGLGLVFGHLRLRTDSLVAPIALHALVNGVNLAG